MSNIDEWLYSIGLSRLAPLLRDHGVDIDVLDALTDTDLADIGLSLGDRRRLMAAILSRRGSLASHSDELAGGYVGRQRRLVSVLFADLVGSTSLSEALELEEFHGLIRQYHDTANSIVTSKRGTVAQFLGDGVLAYFGFPDASEECAAEAIDAGLAIAKSVAEIEVSNAGCQQARVGIATGVVLVGAARSGGLELAVGEALNLAARIQSQASAGEVAVDERTKKLSSSSFTWRSLGNHQLKGFSERQGIWRPLSKARFQTRFDARQLGASATWIERSRELTGLMTHWRSTCSGVGTSVIVRGEPGIGKSRLVHEFRQLVSATCQRKITLQCSPADRGSPLRPLVTELERVIGFRHDQSVNETRDLLEAWLQAEFFGDTEALRLYSILLGIGDGFLENAQKETQENFRISLRNLIKRHLLHIANHGPLFLLIEDIQWIDPSTETLLLELIDIAKFSSILVVATSRIDYDVTELTNAGAIDITIDRFSKGDILQLIQIMDSERVLADQLADAIAIRSEGIPLFAEELTKNAIDLSNCSQATAQSVDNLKQRIVADLPLTLQSSLLARIDRIVQARHIVPIASAIGRRFSTSLLQSITGFEARTLIPALERLCQADILRRCGNQPHAVYEFRHAMIQDAAYATLHKTQARNLHARIATILLEAYPEYSAARPDIAARHHLLAQEWRHAKSQFLAASRLARRRAANIEAVSFLRQALAANEHSREHAERVSFEIRAREELCVPLEATSWGSPSIVENLRRLEVLRPIEKNSDDRLYVLHGLAGDHIIRLHLAEASRIAHAVLALRTTGDNALIEALAYRHLGIIKFFQGRFDQSLPNLARAIDAAASVPRHKIEKYYVADTKTVATAMSAWCAMMAGDFSAGSAFLRQISPPELKYFDPFTRVYALAVSACAYQASGNPNLAEKLADDAGELAQLHKIPYWEAWAMILSGWATVHTRKSTGGLSTISDGIRQYAATGARQLLPYAQLLLADAALKLDDIAKAQQSYKIYRDEWEFSEALFLARLSARIDKKLACHTDKKH